MYRDRIAYLVAKAAYRDGRLGESLIEEEVELFMCTCQLVAKLSWTECGELTELLEKVVDISVDSSVTQDSKQEVPKSEDYVDGKPVAKHQKKKDPQ